MIKLQAGEIWISHSDAYRRTFLLILGINKDGSIRIWNLTGKFFADDVFPATITTNYWRLREMDTE